MALAEPADETSFLLALLDGRDPLDERMITPGLLCSGRVVYHERGSARRIS